MPQPHLRPVIVNDVVQGVAKLFQAQLEGPRAAEQSPAKWILRPVARPVAADAELLHRALSNLVLNAMDAMPTVAP